MMTQEQINQQKRDKADEAAVLHNQASIDMEHGDYDPAQEKYRKVLEIEQQIDDKANEATTCAQIGIIAAMEGRVEEGLRLVALSSMILDEIDHDDFERAMLWINRLVSELECSPDRFEAMCGAVVEAYRQDQGRGLVEAALGAR